MPICLRFELPPCCLLTFLVFLHCIFCSYTDPGTGSLIWQLLMATGFGLMFYARNFLSKVKAFLIKNPEVKETDTDE